MGGKKAQVALFVLAGVIVLFMVALTLYLISQQRAATSTSTNEQLELQQNPALAVEKAQMQTTVNNCLQATATDVIGNASANGLNVQSISDAEQLLANTIALRFPDCFFQYNTAGKLTITDENVPSVTVTLGTDQVLVNANYAVQGTLNGLTYHLSSYQATVTSGLRGMLETNFAVQQQIANSLSGKGDTSSFISPDGYVDLYAFADQNQYLDLLVNPDGTCTVYVTDYNRMIAGKATTPDRTSFTPTGPCIPQSSTQTPEKVNVLDPAPPVTCHGDDNACPITFSSTLPEGFAIISALDVDPLTWTLNAAKYPPGQYLVLAQATGDDASQPTTLQGVIVTINPLSTNAGAQAS